MIVAAGLTPAWQQILTFSEFQPGEVNRARTATRCASGKVLNVGLALHQLQAKSRTVCIFGGETGRLMQSEYESQGVSTRWVPSEIPTRVCTTILDESTGITTELVENSRSILPTELDDFAAAFAHEAASADWVVLSGSLPRQTPTDFYRRLMETTSANVIMDVRGDELLACLPLKPFLVKPNREELGLTLGRAVRTDEDLLAAMHQLQSLGAQRVVISQGAREVWLLNSEGLMRFQPPSVRVVNPIGCGDCLAAGITLAFSEGHCDQDAVRFGIAAATENVQQLLPARLDRSRVEERWKSQESAPRSVS